MKSSIFWDITPYSSFKVNRRFGKTCSFHLQGRRIASLCLPPAFALISCVAYSSILKMEAICSSETSVYFQRTTRRYIPEDKNSSRIVCIQSARSYCHYWLLFTVRKIMPEKLLTTAVSSRSSFMLLQPATLSREMGNVIQHLSDNVNLFHSAHRIDFILIVITYEVTCNLKQFCVPPFYEKDLFVDCTALIRNSLLGN
jgi:hypothetical protein